MYYHGIKHLSYDLHTPRAVLEIVLSGFQTNCTKADPCMQRFVKGIYTIAKLSGEFESPQQRVWRTVSPRSYNYNIFKSAKMILNIKVHNIAQTLNILTGYNLFYIREF